MDGSQDRGRRFEDGAATLLFATAGKARLTLVSRRSGTRFTYSIERPKAQGPLFVAVLNGPSNETDYAFLGTLFGNANPLHFVHGSKSRIGSDAPSAKAFAWAWRSIGRGALPPDCEVFHEGRCGKCGRVLTTPESVMSGIGPVCAARREAA